MSEIHTEERRPDDVALKLIDAIDQLNEVAHLLEAAFMAASDLTVEHQNAMKAVIGCAAKKLDAARDNLETARLQRKEVASV